MVLAYSTLTFGILWPVLAINAINIVYCQNK